jgi:hypothetical protein
VIRKASVIAGVGVTAAMFVIAGLAQAGTCQPVSAKGRAMDPATATTRAQAKLVQHAARMGGKLMNSSTTCKQGPLGAECKMSAAVCP